MKASNELTKRHMKKTVVLKFEFVTNIEPYQKTRAKAKNCIEIAAEKIKLERNDTRIER